MLNQKKEVKAVLFDFDGVLAATMEDHFRAWKKALGGFGIHLDAEDFYPDEGLAMDKLASKYCRENGINPLLVPEILKKKEQHYLNDHRFKLYDGVPETIRRLKSKKVFIAIVTTGLKNRILKSAPNSFLMEFDLIITANDVQRGKPFPDPYLKAASSLGVSPRSSVVVENSPMGIQSAKTAGAYCVGIESTLSEDYLKGADEIIEEFKDLPETQIFKNLLK